MKRRTKRFAVPVLLSGLWGAAVYLLTLTQLYELTFTGLLFYPVLITGPVLIASACKRRGGSYMTSALAGLVSGLIYQLVSPLFPFLASVLAGASLGGALSREGGGFFTTALSALIGIVVFTVLIALGGIISRTALYLTGSLAAYWLLWGALIGTGVMFLVPSKGNEEGKERGFTHNNIPYEELKAETRDIKRELDELGR
jgi:hypothetical protein